VTFHYYYFIYLFMCKNVKHGCLCHYGLLFVDWWGAKKQTI
jgi:hypothetical protein